MANYRHPALVPPPPDACVILDQLCVWGTDPAADGRIDYLGYPLLLSPAERLVLLCFLRAAEAGLASVDADILTDALTKAGDIPDESADAPSTSAVSVYIGRINRKARDIGGRNLILHDRRRGYRLNPYM